MARTRMVKRWCRNMEVSDDAQYVDTLTTLSEGSVRRNFNPYCSSARLSPGNGCATCSATCGCSATTRA